jgi:hypothetical protein
MWYPFSIISIAPMGWTKHLLLPESTQPNPKRARYVLASCIPMNSLHLMIGATSSISVGYNFVSNCWRRATDQTHRRPTETDRIEAFTKGDMFAMNTRGLGIVLTKIVDILIRTTKISRNSVLSGIRALSSGRDKSSNLLWRPQPPLTLWREWWWGSASSHSFTRIM